MAQTKAQLQAEIDQLRSDMVALAEYLRTAAAAKDAEFRSLEGHAFARGLAGGSSNGFALAAQWILEELANPR
jgi:hypothetical protein